MTAEKLRQAICVSLFYGLSPAVMFFVKNSQVENSSDDLLTLEDKDREVIGFTIRK